MITVVVDCCAFDVLAETEERLDAVNAAVEAGELRMLTVRQVRDEVTEIPDDAKRDRLLRLRTEITQSVFVLNHSRLDGPDGLAGPVESAAYREVHTPGGPHRVDATLLAATARTGATLVTEEGRLTKKARAQDRPVITARDLLHQLGIS